MKKRLHVAIIVPQKSEKKEFHFLKQAEHVAHVMEKESFVPELFRISDKNGGPLEFERIKQKANLACVSFREGGEEGHIQHACETISLPHTGSDALVSSLCANKFISGRVLMDHHIKTPLSAYISKEHWQKDKDNIFKKIKLYFGNSFVVKPNFENEKKDVVFVNDASHILYVFDALFKKHKGVLVQEELPGKEVSCFVLDHGFQESAYALSPIPISSTMTQTKEIEQNILPYAYLPQEEREIKRIALASHNALRCKGYSKIDMMKNKKGIWNVLEVNTVPDFYGDSIFREAQRRSHVSEVEILSQFLKAGIYKHIQSA